MGGRYLRIEKPIHQPQRKTENLAMFFEVTSTSDDSRVAEAISGNADPKLPCSSLTSALWKRWRCHKRWNRCNLHQPTRSWKPRLFSVTVLEWNMTIDVTQNFVLDCSRAYDYRKQSTVSRTNFSARRLPLFMHTKHKSSISTTAEAGSDPCLQRRGVGEIQRLIG